MGLESGPRRRAAPGRCAWCGRPLAPSARAAPHVSRCPRCGAGTTQPWPDDDALDASYGAAYRPAAGRFRGPGDRLLAATRGALARRVDAIAPPGPVLDVGSGDGSLLRALRRRGREALGLERSPAPGVRDARVRDLEAGWAAIVLWHSLEHLSEPAAELAAAVERLAPRGVLVVAVPDLGSLQARAFGDRWLALDLPRHLVHLPRAVLVGRLRALGLEVERVSGWRGGQGGFGMLHGLVGLLPGSPDLYEAVRRPQARMRGQDAGRRRTALASAVALAPAAGLAALLEVALGHGGSTYVEARRVR